MEKQKDLRLESPLIILTKLSDLYLDMVQLLFSPIFVQTNENLDFVLILQK